jgi:hypothetical protein
MANQQGVDVGYFYNSESTGMSSLLVTLIFTVEITAWKQFAKFIFRTGKLELNIDSNDHVRHTMVGRP